MADKRGWRTSEWCTRPHRYDRSLLPLPLQVGTAVLHVLVVVPGQCAANCTMIGGFSCTAEQCHCNESFGTVSKVFVIMALFCCRVCEYFRYRMKEMMQHWMQQNCRISSMWTESHPEQYTGVVTVNPWAITTVYLHVYAVSEWVVS